MLILTLAFKTISHKLQELWCPYLVFLDNEVMFMTFDLEAWKKEVCLG